MSVAATYLAAQIALMLWDTNHREPWKIMGYIERGSTLVLLGVSGLIFLVHTYCFITWIRRLRKDRKDKGLSRDGDEGLNQPGGFLDDEKVIPNSDVYNVTFQAGTSGY
ncbi:hypothetical protein LguiB_018638 [Lonicera macranthoides]